MYNKYVLLILISFNLSQTIFSQANSESSKNSELEKQKLQYELDELENRKEIIRDRILELEKSTDLKKETSLKNEEEFFKLEDSIVITASKREQKVTDAPSAIYVITDKQIRERGYRWLSDALKDTPGFDIQNMYGQFPTLFHQRGIVGNNQRTLFYIDGLPDMGISEQSVRAGNTEYPLHNVKRIEILAGPAAALHGSGAFSGTINIITKDGKGNPGNSIDVTYGTWESNFRNPSYMTNFSVRGSGKQDESFQYSVSGYYYKTQGPNFGQNQHLDKKNINPNNVDYALESNACGGTCKPDGNSVGYYWSPKYNMSGADTYNISGKLSVGGFRFQTINWQYLQGAGTFNNGTYVSDFKERGLETNNFDSRNNFRRVGLIYGISPAGSRGSEIHNRQNALSVGYLYKFNARTSIDSEVFARQTDVISSTFNENLKKVGPNSEYRPGGFNLATFSRPDYSYGIRETFEYTKNQHLSTISGLEGTYFNIPKGNSPLTAIDRFEIRNLALYLQQAYRPLEDLTLTAGYRYDYNSVFGEIHTPRFAAIYNLTKNFTLKGLLGSGFRAPTGQEMFATSAVRKLNSNLKPERLKSTELGFGYRFLSNYYLSVMSYYSSISDIIIDAQTFEANPQRPGSFFSQNQNIGGAKIYGTEISTEFKFTDKLKVFFNYTYNKGTYTDIIGAVPSTQGRVGDDYIIDIFNKIMKTNAVPNTGAIPVIAPHKANIGFTYYILNKLSFHIGINYSDVRRNIATNPVKSTERYIMGKLNIRWEDLFYNGMFMQIQVYNLSNTQYFDPGARSANGQQFATLLPLERRNIWFSVGYNF